MMPANTKNARTSVASSSRYSAIPPHTPAMTLLVVLRSRRDGMTGLPSLAQLEDDRDGERGEDARRHDGCLRRLDDARERHRDLRQRGERGVECVGEQRWREHGNDGPDRRGDNGGEAHRD